MTIMGKPQAIALILAAPTAVVSLWFLELYHSSLFPWSPPSPQIATSSPVHSSRQQLTPRPSHSLSQVLGGSPSNSNECLKEKPQKIWFAPYRQFPEAAPEGNWRGKGDYEYFSLLNPGRCTRFQVNYGALKNSPADIAFTDASLAGLSNEFKVAKQLGFEWFILDLNKVWLTTSEIEDACKESKNCQLTTDNFAAISIAGPDVGNKFENLLKSAYRMQNYPIETLLDSYLIVDASEWYGLESYAPGNVQAWSKISEPGGSVKLGGARSAHLPINLDIFLLPSPSIKSISVQFDCADGSTLKVGSISKKFSIAKILRTCKPQALTVTHFEQANPPTTAEGFSGELLRLSDSDPRISALGINTTIN